MSEDLSLKDFKKWLEPQKNTGCGKIVVTQTVSLINRFEESQKPRYELIYDGANRSWDIIDNKYDKMKVRSYYIDAMDFDEIYPTRYVEYLNNKEDD